MINVLIIGCGNIGAMYDLNTKSILTHTKAFSLISNCNLYLFDINLKLSKKISEIYKAQIVNSLDKVDFSKFEIICICSPTNTHFQLLKRSLESNVNVIICEKPISYSIEELRQLKKLYSKSKSKVIVNYIRRFQPYYKESKKYVTDILSKEKLTNISIKYQRGFLNNCSHAFDIISFLTSLPLKLVNIKKNNIVFDSFENDATLSIQASWNNSNVCILGLSNLTSTVFEVELFFENVKVELKESGNTINFYNSCADTNNKLLKNSLLSKNNCLNNYMKHISKLAIEMTKDISINDNFIESLNLNLLMLKYIK